MAVGEPLTTESPLVTLTGLVLSYIILKAETATFFIRNHPKLGTSIAVGDREFSGDDEAKVVEQFLRWIIEREVTMTKDDFDKVDLGPQEPENIEQLAEEFAAGGMSEFGKIVEAARFERTGIIDQALLECNLTTEVHVADLMETIKSKTRLEDLEIAEVLDRIKHMEQHNLLSTSLDATGTVVTSTDKPN